MSYHVNAEVLNGKHLTTTPRNIRSPVKTIAFLSPLVSKNHKTGNNGIKYMILPQLPKSASVFLVQSGQKTANKEFDIGPMLFQIIPCKMMKKKEKLNI